MVNVDTMARTFNDKFSSEFFFRQTVFHYIIIVRTMVITAERCLSLVTRRNFHRGLSNSASDEIVSDAWITRTLMVYLTQRAD